MATQAPSKPAPVGKNEALVEKQLRRAQLRIRLLDIASAALGFLILTFVFGLVMALGDRWLHNLPAAARQLGLAVYVSGAIAYLGFFVVRPLCRRVNPYYAARKVEESLGGAKNSLVNWLDLRSEPMPAAFRSAVAHRAAKDLSRADLDRAVSSRRSLWLAGITFALTLILALQFAFGARDFLSRLFRVFAPFGSGKVVKNTEIILLEPRDGDATISVGRAVNFVVEINGTVPNRKKADAVRLLFRHQQTEDYETKLFEREGGGSSEWRAQVPAFQVNNGFWYKVAAGDTETPEYHITTRSTPFVSDINVEYRYPDYLAWPNEAKHDPNIQAMRGTKVTVLARTNRNVNAEKSKLDLVGEGDIKGEAVPGEPEMLRFTFTVDKDGSYRIWFESLDGERNTDPLTYPIKAMHDYPPVVEITRPEKESSLPVNGVLQVEGKAKDDFGVTGIKLMMQLAAGEQPFSKPFRDGKKEQFQLVDKSYPQNLEYKDFVELEKLRTAAGQPLKAGMVIEYWLEATDACDYPPPGPNVGKSEVHKLTLTAPDKNPQNQEQKKDQAKQDQKEFEQKQDKKLDDLNKEKQDELQQKDPEKAEEQRKQRQKEKEDLLEKLQKELDKKDNQSKQKDDGQPKPEGQPKGEGKQEPGAQQQKNKGEGKEEPKGAEPAGEPKGEGKQEPKGEQQKKNEGEGKGAGKEGKPEGEPKGKPEGGQGDKKPQPNSSGDAKPEGKQGGDQQKNEGKGKGEGKQQSGNEQKQNEGQGKGEGKQQNGAQQKENEGQGKGEGKQKNGAQQQKENEGQAKGDGHQAGKPGEEANNGGKNGNDPKNGQGDPRGAAKGPQRQPQPAGQPKGSGKDERNANNEKGGAKGQGKPGQGGNGPGEEKPVASKGRNPDEVTQGEAKGEGGNNDKNVQAAKEKVNDLVKQAQSADKKIREEALDKLQELKRNGKQAEQNAAAKALDQMAKDTQGQEKKPGSEGAAAKASQEIKDLMDQLKSADRKRQEDAKEKLDEIRRDRKSTPADRAAADEALKEKEAEESKEPGSPKGDPKGDNTSKGDPKDKGNDSKNKGNKGQPGQQSGDGNPMGQGQGTDKGQQPAKGQGSNPGQGTERTGDGQAGGSDGPTVPGSEADKKHHSKGGELQLDPDWWKRVTPEMRQKLNISDEEWKKFVKAMQEEQTKRVDEKLPAGPNNVRGGLTNTAPKLSKGSDIRTDNVQSGGRSVAPPELREGFKAFTEKAGSGKK